MLHKFLEPGDWFAAKRIGYGAGRPIAWQGWALMAAYGLALTGLGIALPFGGGVQGVAAGLVMIVLTGLFLLVVKTRTRGGWRWRSGEE